MMTKYYAYFLGLYMTALAVKVQPCELPVLNKCLTNYVTEFAKQTSLTKRELHCKADRELGLCVKNELSKCPGGLVVSLGKAILSYIIFDKRIGVCPKLNYRDFYNQLKRAGGHNGMDKINKQLQMYGSTCAKQSDIKCIKSYVTQMMVDQNLCVNIPNKYQCLRDEAKTCKDEILKRLLDVFPEEADKVLKVLCQSPQDGT